MQQLSAILAKRLPSNSTKSIESIVVRAKSSESSKGRRVDEVDRVDRRPSQVDRMHWTRSTAGYSALDNIWHREREVPSSSPRMADMLCRLLLAPCIAGCLFC